MTRLSPDGMAELLGMVSLAGMLGGAAMFALLAVAEGAVRFVGWVWRRLRAKASIPVDPPSVFPGGGW